MNREKALRQRRGASPLCVFVLLVALFSGGATSLGHAPITIGDRSAPTIDDEITSFVMERDRSKRSVARESWRVRRSRARWSLRSFREIVRRLRVSPSVEPDRFDDHFSPPLRGPPSVR
jgi:hypothetical protein